MRVRRLVMLRHGQTEYNAGSRMQGQLDTELSDLGRDQAVAAAEVLAKRQPLIIVSSDLRRALDTAVALGERSGMPVLVDTRLRETHLGDWQGMTHLEVDAAAPGAPDRSQEDLEQARREQKAALDEAAGGHVQPLARASVTPRLHARRRSKTRSSNARSCALSGPSCGLDPISLTGCLPSRLIAHRHRPRAEFQPAHEPQVDMLR